MKEGKEKPTEIKTGSIADVIEACQDYIDFMDKVDPNSGELDRQDDYQNAIFEEAMICFFGDNVFDWINSKIP